MRKSITPLDPNQAEIVRIPLPADKARTVAALRALGYPKGELRAAANNLISQAAHVRRALGRMEIAILIIETSGSWTAALTWPQEDVAPEHRELSAAICEASAARAFGRLQ